MNHFDNKVVVKFEDGAIELLDGADVRRGQEAQPVLEEDLPLAHTDSLELASARKDSIEA